MTTLYVWKFFGYDNHYSTMKVILQDKVTPLGAVIVFLHQLYGNCYTIATPKIVLIRPPC